MRRRVIEALGHEPPSAIARDLVELALVQAERGWMAPPQLMAKHPQVVCEVLIRFANVPGKARLRENLLLGLHGLSTQLPTDCLRQLSSIYPVPKQDSWEWALGSGLLAKAGVRTDDRAKELLSLLQSGSERARNAALAALLSMGGETAVQVVPQLKALAQKGRGSGCVEIMFAALGSNNRDSALGRALAQLAELYTDKASQDNTLKPETFGLVMVKFSIEPERNARATFKRIGVGWGESYVQDHLRMLADLLLFTPEEIARFSSLLEDEHPLVRGGAARFLGYIGIKSCDHLDRIIPLLHDQDQGVREAAIGAVARIASPPAAIKAIRGERGEDEYLGSIEGMWISTLRELEGCLE